MAITLKTHKMLWGRAGNRCALCKTQLVVDPTETDDESLIGDEAHIVAKKKDGPRGDSPLPASKRDLYGNLVLLCRNCHKTVDDQVSTYSVDYLKEKKEEHERWVRDSLAEYSDAKQKDDEYYAAIIEEIARKAGFDNWLQWTSHLISGDQPCMIAEVDEELKELRLWLLSRVWPKRYTELEASINNFRSVLGDLYSVFHRHSEVQGSRSDYLITNKFYRIDEWNKEIYDKLVDSYQYHVDLVEDLLYELTRAANYLCDMVRKYIFSSYRLKEGVLLVEAGMFFDLSYRTFRLEYRGRERCPSPYPGLEKFLTERSSRDLHKGEGEDPSGLDLSCYTVD